ncbi:MAG: response regulator [Spirochaetes bacterium]|nr:response regulator [Spirochaetota bacterium]
MHNVLVVDLPPYKDKIVKIYRESGYRVQDSESAFDAMGKLKTFDFDLIVSEVELPGDNAFELYNYIQTHYPYIPMIMITEKQIDIFFERIFQEGIGNVLCKPIVKEELVNLTQKLITRKKIFGLQNYMGVTEDIKKIRIKSSAEIRDSIDKAISKIEEWKFDIGNKTILKLVLNEIIINAVYHSHGYGKQKEERKKIDLKKDEHVDLFFAKNCNGYGIAIDDYRGKLTKAAILENLNKAIKQSEMIIRAYETGEEISEEISETGRGLDMLRKIAKDYYFIIKKNVRTEVIILFNNQKSAGQKGTSLKIIEDV